MSNYLTKYADTNLFHCEVFDRSNGPVRYLVRHPVARLGHLSCQPVLPL